MKPHAPTTRTIHPHAIALKTALVAAMCLASATAMAGRSSFSPVTIVQNADGSGGASGDTRTARRSANVVEEIGCSVTASESIAGDPSSVRFTGSCRAWDAAGRFAVCTSRDRRLLEAVRNATSFSFIRFNWRPDGTCSLITYVHSSSMLP